MIMKFFDEDNKDSSVTSVLEFEGAQLTHCKTWQFMFILFEMEEFNCRLINLTILMHHFDELF